MPNSKQVCGDDDQFVNSKNEVAEELARAREEIKPNGIVLCEDCGKLILPARKKAVLGAVRCAGCQWAHEEEQRRKEDSERGL